MIFRRDRHTQGEGRVWVKKNIACLISCSIVQGISDYCGVLLHVEWEENGDVILEKQLIQTHMGNEVTDTCVVTSSLQPRLLLQNHDEGAPAHTEKENG
jgi:hypothetical protein